MLEAHAGQRSVSTVQGESWRRRINETVSELPAIGLTLERESDFALAQH